MSCSDCERKYQEKNQMLKKLTMVTLFTPEISSWANGIGENKKRYCERHNIGNVTYSATLCKDRPASWSKVLAIQEAFRNGVEVCFWNDADWVIQGQGKSLSDFWDSEYDLIIGRNISYGVNCGAFFLKNSPASIEFLDKVWNCDPYYYFKPLWEQSQFCSLLARATHNLKVKIVESYLWNSSSSYYRPGDFAIHFCGDHKHDLIERIRIGKLYDIHYTPDPFS